MFHVAVFLCPCVMNQCLVHMKIDERLLTFPIFGVSRKILKWRAFFVVYRCIHIIDAGWIYLVFFFRVANAPREKHSRGMSADTFEIMLFSIWRLFEDAFLGTFYHFHSTSDLRGALFDKTKRHTFRQTMSPFLSGILSTCEVARICRIPTNLSSLLFNVYALRVSSNIQKRNVEKRTRRSAIVRIKIVCRPKVIVPYQIET